MVEPSQPYFFEGIQNNQFYETVMQPAIPATVTPAPGQPVTMDTDPAPVTIPVTQPAANAVQENRNYYTDFILYVKAQQIVGNCNAICFFNNGVSTAVVNKVLTLAPNTGVAINGERNETDVTQYTVTFSGSGQNSLLVIRKIYNS